MQEVKRFLDQEKFQEDVAYSLSDLSTAMMKQAALFAYYGTLHAKASAQARRMKLRVETIEAVVYRKLKKKLEDAGEKITDVSLRRDVASEKSVIAANSMLATAEEEEILTKTAVEAFRHRRDMLIQAGLLSREEMKGELTIAKRNVAEEGRKEMEGRLLDGIKNRKNGSDE